MPKYILVHCSVGTNHTPRLFNTKEGAKKAFDKIVSDLIENSKNFIFEEEVYEEQAILTYADRTWDNLEIFEVEEEN